MSRCNYCMFGDIEKHAASCGGTVETRPAPKAGLTEDGVDIYVNYPGDPAPVWAAWLMKLPERCVC